MADEIEEKLLERVKQQGELVRKLKAVKANDIQVGAITFTYYAFIYILFIMNFLMRWNRR